MRKRVFILLLLLVEISLFQLNGQNQPDFEWGNSQYFNLNIGEKIFVNETEIKLLKIENHFNQLKIGSDTVWIKVSRRRTSSRFGDFNVFVADNINVKAITKNKSMHGLLTGDVLLCISQKGKTFIDHDKYVFPISYNDGFLWSAQEDSHLFSYINLAEKKGKDYETHPGIDFDLNDARGIEMHRILAIENSRVVWIEEEGLDRFEMEACVLLESESQAGIYYFYKHLNQKKLEVRKGQKLLRAEPIGAIWGDEVWGNLHFAVIRSDTVPGLSDCNKNIVNCFPQIFELYFKQPYGQPKHYTKGRILFGRNRMINGNEKNASAFETYTGKGWKLGKWNLADKVENVTKGNDGNVRLNKVLFKKEKAKCTNPNNWYEYEIAVSSGIYRIRAKIGDNFLPTWQNVQFENVDAGNFTTEKGKFKWTSEKVVKVKDGRMTIRIYIDETGKMNAGLNEIVFQKAG